MMKNIMLLMRDALEDNKIDPERLHASLVKFIFTLDQLDSDKLKDREIELLLIREIARGTEEFILLLELCTMFHKMDAAKL